MIESLLNKKAKQQLSKTSIPTQAQTTQKRSTQKHMTIKAVGDTGATDMLVRQADAHKLAGYVAGGGHVMVLPNGQSITSTGTGEVRLPENVDLTAHVFPDDILMNNLAPIAPLCNQGCTAVFTATGATVTHGGTVILQGTKEPKETLWQFQIPIKAPLACSGGQANLVVSNQLDADYVAWTAATLGGPVTSTLLKAVKRGYLSTFPRITYKMIAANPPNAMATAMGHLDHTRQGQNSTKTEATGSSPQLEDYEDNDPLDPEEGRVVFVKIIPASNILHSDATARMPVPSRRGYQYFLLSYWNNYLHLEAMSSRSKNEYARAFKATYDFFHLHGAHPRVQRLDNETSQVVEKQLLAVVDKVDYVAPANHRANKAERGIRDAKNHLIATFCGADPSYPAAELDRFLEQAEITLNILRPYRPRPDISAYEGVYGQKYDFAAHPMAPCGVRVLVYEQTSVRGSWAPHGVPGFYLGPALKHYRSFRTLVDATHAERISDTLAWFPVRFRMPGSSPLEVLHAAIKDLSAAMAGLAATPHRLAAERQPFERCTKTLLGALRDLSTLYNMSEADGTRPKAPVTAANDEARQPSTTTTPPPPPPPPLPPNPTSPSGAGLLTTTINGDEVDGAGEQRVLQQQQSVQQRVQDELAAPPGFTHLGPTPHADAPNVAMAPPTFTTAPTKPVKIAKNKKSLEPSDRVTRQGAREDGQHAAAFSAVGINTERTRPGEIKGTAKPRRTRHRGRASSVVNMGTSNGHNSTTALNLTADGVPLTYRLVKSGPDAALWEEAECDEFDRLMERTQTMKPIQPQDQPQDRRKDTTYYTPQPVEKMLATGGKTRRIRGAAGGDHIHFPGDVSARCAGMSDIKILINSVVSDGANWMSIDIKDFYLGTPMDRPEFMRIPVRMTPNKIMEKYNLQQFVHNGSVLFQIDKGMYGLPQAGRLAQNRLVSHLDKHGYKQAPHSPCIFRHIERQTAFSLVVDDFGVKYVRREEDAGHLIETLQKLYEIKVDWSGRKYLGFNITFAADNKSVSLDMPDYIPKVHQRFQARIKHGRGAASPAVYIPPAYGTHSQMTEVDDSSPATPAETKEVQEIVGCIMFYARAVDGTMLTAVNHIASEMKDTTQQVTDMTDRLLAYTVEYPNNALVLTACDMILHVQTDASYLSRSGARSVVGGLEYLGNKKQPTHINGAVHTFSTILDVVVASAGEAEYGGVFVGGKHAEGSRATLEFLGYPQPPTIILCDSACAVGIANDKVKIKRTKSIDMRFHWIRDRIRQGHFDVQWRKGAHNLADFYTKALPVYKHQELMPFLVHIPAGRHGGTNVRKARRAHAH